MNKENNNEDFYLIEKVKERNQDAFKVLMIKYQPRIYSALFGYVKSKEDAEDLTQQVFIRVWNKIDSFRGDSAFFTWIYRIAINLAKNHFASSASKKDKVNISSDDLEIDIPSYENPEISLMHKQSLQNIQSYVKTLPESLKTACTLREVDGKSYEEISVITNTPIGTVRSRIFRARESIINYINGGNENHG